MTGHPISYGAFKEVQNHRGSMSVVQNHRSHQELGHQNEVKKIQGSMNFLEIAC